MQTLINKLELHNPLLKGNPIDGYTLKDHSEEWLVSDRGEEWLYDFLFSEIRKDPFVAIDKLHYGDYSEVYITKYEVVRKYAVKYAKMAHKKTGKDPSDFFNEALSKHLEEDPIGFLCGEYSDLQKEFTGKEITHEKAFDIWSTKMVDLEETLKHFRSFLPDPIEALEELGFTVVCEGEYIALKRG